MSRHATNHRAKGSTMGTRRPKSALSKRRSKARARVLREKRQAALQITHPPALMVLS